MQKIREEIKQIYTWKYLRKLPVSLPLSCVMFFILSFLFFKIGEQEGGKDPAQMGGLAPVQGEVMGKEGRR
jgi:hypothetical protein